MQTEKSQRLGRHSVNHVSGIIRLPSGSISRSESETDDGFYFLYKAQRRQFVDIVQMHKEGYSKEV